MLGLSYIEAAMTLAETLLAEIEGYLTRTGMKPTAFGQAVAGDPSFVFELREGREPRAGTIDKVRNFMATPQPDEAAA